MNMAFIPPKKAYTRNCMGRKAVFQKGMEGETDIRKPVYRTTKKAEMPASTPMACPRLVALLQGSQEKTS